MNEGNHIANSPGTLLEFLKKANDAGIMQVESLPFRFSFVMEATYDAVTIIRGYWLNAVELVRILSMLEGYDISKVTTLHLTYITGVRQPEDSTNLMADAQWYEVHIGLE